jgi:hypothetical protein
MNAIERRLRAAVNRVSTAITRWWCQSAMRHLLTGHGPSANQRRLRRHTARAAARTRAQHAARATAQHATRATAQGADRTAAPSAETMRARADAIEKLLAQQDHQT